MCDVLVHAQEIFFFYLGFHATIENDFFFSCASLKLAKCFPQKKREKLAQI